MLASAVPQLPSSLWHPWPFTVTAVAGSVRLYLDLFNGVWINTVRGLMQCHGQRWFSLLCTWVLRSSAQTLGPAAALEVPAPRTTCQLSMLLGEEMEHRPQQDVLCQGTEAGQLPAQPFADPTAGTVLLDTCSVLAAKTAPG